MLDTLYTSWTLLACSWQDIQYALTIVSTLTLYCEYDLRGCSLPADFDESTETDKSRPRSLHILDYLRVFRCCPPYFSHISPAMTWWP